MFIEELSGVVTCLCEMRLCCLLIRIFGLWTGNWDHLRPPDGAFLRSTEQIGEVAHVEQ